ncbi:similar to hypothetical protein MGC36831 (predicted), isoform CRA_a [Rattus norvegicus]|uniref:Uncharacterized protein RGD1306215_predicted n=1 Tax=Rattus norvegicus TaxID=10116 RepID=A6JT66_RAT|nr:similar to hypothetical protein MGC36831 (predicted), isoform CRA_a [Rattus norvegicus]
MTLSGDTSALAFDLSKVPSPEAAPRLQALTLSLAEHVCNLERRLAATEETAISPRKSTQPAGTQFLPELDHQRGSSGSGVRRRCPGESLVNPGFKRYLPPVFPTLVPSFSSLPYILSCLLVRNQLVV